MASLMHDPQISAGLLIFQRGVTTSAAQQALLGSPYASQLITGPRVLLLSADASWRVTLPPLPERFWRMGRFAVLSQLFILLGCVLAVAARFVADVEAAACAADGCDERPATYWNALYWLVSRLLDGDPEGTGAATVSVRVIGLLTTVVGMVVLAGVLVGVIATAISHRLAPPDSADPQDGLLALNVLPQPAPNTAVAKRKLLGRPVTVNATVSSAAVLVCGMALGAYVSYRCRARVEPPQ
ncbi:hypothetical protein BXY51_008468 [Actinoplanes cyaneus]|nr:hypothetical protein [Actinoplanes cyaneus]